MNKNLVLDVLDEGAVIGTYYWGKRRDGIARPREEWLAIEVTPIVDQNVYDLAQHLRRARDLGTGAGRAAAQPRALSGLVVCGRCGATCQLETSGKTIDGTRYRHCYYSCRTYCRAGKEECAGVRVATEVLDGAVLAQIADAVCTPRRVDQLRRHLEPKRLDVDDLATTWRALITCNLDVGRAYVMHLMERIELHDDRAVLVPKVVTDGL